MKPFILILLLSLSLMGCHQPSQVNTQSLRQVEMINDLSGQTPSLVSASESNIYVLSKQDISQLKVLFDEYQKLTVLFNYFNPVEDLNAQTFPNTFDYAKKEEIQQAYLLYQTDMAPIIQAVFDTYFQEIHDFKSEIAKRKQIINAIKNEEDKNEEGVEYSQKKSTRLFHEEMALGRQMDALEEYKAQGPFLLFDKMREAFIDRDIKQLDLSIVYKSLLEDIYKSVLINKIEPNEPSLTSLHLPVMHDYYFIYTHSDEADEMLILNMKELRISINNGLYGDTINMSELIKYGVLERYQPNRAMLGDGVIPLILYSVINL